LGKFLSNFVKESKPTKLTRVYDPETGKHIGYTPDEVTE